MELNNPNKCCFYILLQGSQGVDFRRSETA